MLESIPLHQDEHSTVIYGSPQFIKYQDTYNCPRETYTPPHLPFQTIQYPIKVNFITNDVENQTENKAGIHQSSQKIYSKINP
jgi:hypothetical protein